MKVLLSCFDYIKRYHSDMLDCIVIVLEILIFKQKAPNELNFLIAQGKKRKFIVDNFKIYLSQIIDKDIFLMLNPNINILKILRTIKDYEIKAHEIEEFIHIITQKKTTNKLFTYSTPLEINELLISLLDIKKNDVVYNPCYGMGSLFLSFKQNDITLFGEELDPRLSNIAKLIVEILEIKKSNLVINDILKTHKFVDKKFDKIICNPPLFGHVGSEFLKEDKRFHNLGVKSYPEILFLMHCVGHLKEKGVFIIRNQTLQKSSLEHAFRQRLCKAKLIECIIELPKNIFPHQNHDFSIIVLNAKIKNQSILYIDATDEIFYQKDGKYNRLVGIDKIAKLYKNKADSKFSKVTKTSDLDLRDLSASNYVQRKILKHSKNNILLKDLGVSVFRGGQGYKKSDKISFYDIGVADFKSIGFSDKFINKREVGDIAKIKEYILKPYDILMSLRGSSPKFTILDDCVGEITANANAGILVLRAQHKTDAIALYCHFFSKCGQESLLKIYENSNLNIQKLLDLPIPKNYDKNATKIFNQINILSQELESTYQKIKELRE